MKRLRNNIFCIFLLQSGLAFSAPVETEKGVRVAVAFQLVRSGNMQTKKILAMTESFREFWYYQFDSLGQSWIANDRGKFLIYPISINGTWEFPAPDFAMRYQDAARLVGVTLPDTAENELVYLKMQPDAGNQIDFSLSAVAEEQVSVQIEWIDATRPRS